MSTPTIIDSLDSASRIVQHLPHAWEQKTSGSNSGANYSLWSEDQLGTSIAIVQLGYRR